MLKGRWVLGVVAVLLLAAVLACDSNDGKGGAQPAAGYSQADLTGEWAFRATTFLKSFLKFDATGTLVRWKDANGKYFPFVGHVTVAADGSLSGEAAYQVTPTGWEVFVFNDMRFKSKGLITGNIVVYAYIAGIGKFVFDKEPARMTLYIPD